MIVSPCISICKTDPSTGYCYGCGRSNEEKKLWKLDETTDDWKKENLKEIEKRLTGWQFESFNKSYEYKINNGMSLFKRLLITKLITKIIIKEAKIDLPLINFIIYVQKFMLSFLDSNEKRYPNCQIHLNLT